MRCERGKVVKRFAEKSRGIACGGRSRGTRQSGCKAAFEISIEQWNDRGYFIYYVEGVPRRETARKIASSF